VGAPARRAPHRRPGGFRAVRPRSTQTDRLTEPCSSPGTRERRARPGDRDGRGAVVRRV